MPYFEQTDHQTGTEASRGSSGEASRKPAMEPPLIPRPALAGDRLQSVTSENRPLYRQVEDWLETYIRDHALEPGDALPSIATISKTLGIHGLTIRRAIRELAVRDVLVTRQGRGIFVSHGALMRVLWVSGTPLFSTGVGQYQPLLIEQVSLMATKAGVRIEPVTVNQFDVAASRRWLNSYDKLRPFGGFIFCNCGLEHELAHHVFEQRLPAVNIAQRGQSGRWQVTTDLAQSDELAMDAMEAAGCKHVAVVGIDNQPLVSADAVKQRGLKPVILRIAPCHPVEGVTAEQAGYELGCSLLAKHPGVDGWYLTDDIIARGATRALLALEPDATRRPTVVVRSTRQQIISLGMPVKYVLSDLREHARHIFDLLMRQIHHQPGPTQFVGKFKLVDSQDIAMNNAPQISGTS